MNYPKRLIEVDLPISRISAHARREKSIRHGHISTLHTWWARRPLAACRAVILASLWPDPVDLATWQQQAGSSQEVHAPRTEDAEPSEGVDIQPARFLDEARSQMNRWSRIGVSKGKPADGATLDRLIFTPCFRGSPMVPCGSALLRSTLQCIIQVQATQAARKEKASVELLTERLQYFF